MPAVKISGGVLALALALPTLMAHAEIIAYRDDQGRLVYVNTSDRELYATARRGGVSAARRLIQRRRNRMPGIQDHIKETADKERVDPQLVHALIEVESAWNPRARSSKGALGLMQLMPATAERFGVRNALDPSDNVSGGIRYLRYLLDKFDNNLTLALAAYNAGETAVTAYGGVPPFPETTDYLHRIRSVYHGFASSRPSRAGSIYRSVDRNGRLVFMNE